MIDDLDTLSELLRTRANSIGFDLQGPVEIQYGFGWEPTITFWSGSRRIHFCFEVNQDGVTIELSELQLEPQNTKSVENTDAYVMRTVISTFEEAWTIVDHFLHQRCVIEDLGDYNWEINPSDDRDKFIPHPPNAPNPANIVSAVETLKQIGTRWHPPQSNQTRTWWQRLFGRLRKTPEQ